MLFIDGLQCSRYDREVFQELRSSDMGCVTVTVGFWEDTIESLEAISRFRDLVAANADLVQIARSAEEIETIHESGRTALLLGFQNSCAFGGRIRFAELFADLGIRIVQLTYNIQNEVGGSCYEPHDSGLSRFGRELVDELNRVGILVDLSHVGERTSLDTIECSSVPVAVTHANPSELVPHPRNKSSELLRRLAARGGIVGLATYPNITGDYAKNVQDWCDLVARTVDICGVDHVGIGTDLSRKTTWADTQWMRMGRWTRTINYGAGSASEPGKVLDPDWIATTSGFPLIAEELMRKGFSRKEAEAIVGGNWMRVYRSVLKQAERTAPATIAA